MAGKPRGKKQSPPAQAAPQKVSRYAQPHFDAAAAPQPVGTGQQMKKWHMDQLGPIPPAEGGDSIELSKIIGDDAVAEIERIGEIRFHALGDSGVGHADDAEEVANEMATDFKAGADALNPAFLFHLGDVVYGTGKDDHYGERFYRPYQKYPGKILAIPGNHDGEEKSAADHPSLKAFRANFCTTAPTVPGQASGSGIFRETMTLPGIYWLLEAPFVRIVGSGRNQLHVFDVRPSVTVP